MLFKNIIYTITPISRFSTSLIEVGYSIKLFNIKGKGDDLGSKQARFIYVDQNFSKLVR
ncbi:MAG: anthrax toxin-like adenylyl cyclase domain-containing protein [Arsenophonus sp. NEOnobi-MAG3]